MSNSTATLKDQPAAEPVLKLDEFLPYQLNVCSHLVSQALSSIYTERFGIGLPEWRILVTLGEFGSMTAKAVGKHSQMHKTKVSRAVANLERRKFVARRANSADLREAFLSLTPAGRAVYDELAPSAQEFANQLMASVEPGDRAALVRALRKLTERSCQITSGASKDAPEGTTQDTSQETSQGASQPASPIAAQPAPDVASGDNPG